MNRKIAIIVRERQSEALRMSAGITFMDDSIELFFIDRVLENSGTVEINLEIANEMEIVMYTNRPENTDMTCLPTPELQKKLLEYDHIIVY